MSLTVALASSKPSGYEAIGSVLSCVKCGNFKVLTNENASIVADGSKKAFKVFQRIGEANYSCKFNQQGEYSFYRKDSNLTEIVAVQEEHVCKKSDDVNIEVRAGNASLKSGNIQSKGGVSMVVVSNNADPELLKLLGLRN